MRLVIAIVHDRDKSKITDALLANNYQFTRIGSSGGFLHDGNVTLLIGLAEDQTEHLVGVIRGCCKTREQFVGMTPGPGGQEGAPVQRPPKVQVGGAVCFVVNVERFERF